MIKPADAVAAITPPVATITAGQINTALGIATGIASLAFIIWRWHREIVKARAEDAAKCATKVTND
ncbi:MAG: hypothetical protein FJ184_01935 [Gammaproteobacteria bacterium]|nr:hypothetical protein [Gammaproteobacteria bacterium]